MLRRRNAPRSVAKYSTNDVRAYILQLPLELRTLILEFAIQDYIEESPAYHKDDDFLHGEEGEWIPPPFLRCCRQLRFDGMPHWRKKEPRFRICNFNVEQLVEFTVWDEAVASCYLPDDYRAEPATLVLAKNSWTHHDIKFSATSRANRAANLIDWLESAYRWEVCGVVEKKDNSGLGRAQFLVDPDVEEEKKLGDVFTAAFSLQKKGVSWNDALEALRPIIDRFLLLDLF